MSKRHEVCLVLLYQHRYDLAEKEIGRMLAKNPDDERAHCYMAWCMANTGRQQEAMNEADNAIRVAPQDDYSYYIKATCFTKFGQYKQSLEWFREAIRLNSYLPFYYSELSNAFFELRKYKDALRTAEQGLRLHPENVACHNAHTIALKALGRNEEALLGAEKTLKLDPENAKAFHLKGTLLIKGKDFPEADKAVRASLRLQPVNRDAEKDLEVIDEKLDEILEEYLSEHKTIKRLYLLAFISVLTVFFTDNAASIAAGLGLFIFSSHWVNVLKCRPGSRKQKAMVWFAPLQILAGVLAVVFFYAAQPWYSDRTAWFFAMVFCGVVIYEKDIFEEERGILFYGLGVLIGVCALLIGLFSLSLAWVVTSFNCFYLISILDEFRTHRSNLSWRNLGFGFIWILVLLFIDSELLKDWELNKSWYGNGELWIGEFIYMLLCVHFRNFLIETEQTEEERGRNKKLIPLGGSHE